MLTHTRIWEALDLLATQEGLSSSALARKAGLDPTTFNRSKRLGSDGRQRWPSTESIAKALEATGTSLDTFMSLVTTPSARASTLPQMRRAVPLIGLAQAGGGGFFDDAGFPVGGSWDEIAFPTIEGEHVYALEITGDSMLPLYRDGDTVIVAPGEPVRRGDRVIVKTRDGEVMAKELRRKTAKVVELSSVNPDYPPRTLPMEDVVWIARIIWASQ